MFTSECRSLLQTVRECLRDTKRAIHQNEEGVRLGAVPIDLRPLRIQQMELQQLERMLLARQGALN